jgi:hypothetical protein
MSGVKDKLKGIEGDLLTVPEEKFVEIIELLEQVRERPEVQETFTTIRSRLVKVRPQRRLTLKRVLCDPFEDVLEAASLNDSPVGRIDRAVIDPIWAIVEAHGDRRHLSEMEVMVRRTRANDASARHALGCRLWWTASVALRQALTGADANPQARRSFMNGNEDHVRQVRDVVEFLEIGHQIMELRRRLPAKPIPALYDDDLAAIAEVIKDVAKTGTGKPYYLLLVLASRLRRPAELLARIPDMDFGRARHEKPAIFARLSALVVTSMEDRTNRMEGTDPQLLDPGSAVALAMQLVDGLESMCGLMGKVNENIYDDRLKSVRTAVRTMVQTNVMVPAERVILASLPPPPTAGQAVAAPDDDVQVAAEDHARALRRCDGVAAALGLEYTLSETIKSLGKGVETRVERMVGSIDRMELRPDDREALELSIVYGVRMLELVAGSNQADSVRLKAMAALDAALPLA